MKVCRAIPYSLVKFPFPCVKNNLNKIELNCRIRASINSHFKLVPQYWKEFLLKN